MKLLSQNLPGYISDVQPQGGVHPFAKFAALFDPANYSFSGGNVISRIVLLAIIIAGLYFFIKLLSAGYAYLTSTGDPAKIQGATKEITNAFIGLMLIVCTYFIGQILETVFGLKFL